MEQQHVTAYTRADDKQNKTRVTFQNKTGHISWLVSKIAVVIHSYVAHSFISACLSQIAEVYMHSFGKVLIGAIK